MFRVIALAVVSAVALTGCGPASSVFAEEIGYESLKSNANTPALVRGQRSAIESNTYVVAPYDDYGRRGRYR